jgi:hypothetical protein
VLVLAPKARYSTAAWGIAPGCKVEGKTLALKARFTSKHLFASGGLLKRAFSACSAWLFQS